MLKSFLLICAVATIVLAITPGQCSSAQETTPATVQGKNPVKPTAESQAVAKNLYQRDCALCHGDTGNGKSDMATSMNLTMDDWTDPATLANKDDATLFSTIRNGKGTNMPPEDAGRAKDAEVWNLIIYIRSLSKAQPVAPAALAK